MDIFKRSNNLIPIWGVVAFICIVVLCGCSIHQGGDTVDGKAFQQAVHQRDYIVNKRTGKIHSTECSAVSLMSEKNKMQLSNTSLLELVKQGYIVCRKCRAGIKKDNENQNRRNHPNLYGDEIEIIASYDDYIKAIDEMGEWYSNHVPTYQKESEMHIVDWNRTSFLTKYYMA